LLVVFWSLYSLFLRFLVSQLQTQGTRVGDFSIAWKINLPEGETSLDSSKASIHIRAYVPPDGKALFRVPEYSNGEGVDASIKYATILPNLDEAKSHAKEECQERRKSKNFGFGYNWEYNRETLQWYKVHRKKAIGTPCQSFLFHDSLQVKKWSAEMNIPKTDDHGIEIPLKPGLYEMIIPEWQLKPEVQSNNGRIGSLPQYYEAEDVGPYCADTETFDWSIDDAVHLI
jgi:hypothetical protein